MTGHVALEIHGHGHARQMDGGGEHMDGQRGLGAAEALSADAQIVDGLQQLLLKGYRRKNA